ncbi:MAG: hypothetical protein RI842_08310 [Schleiferiaceae bacterium]|nr:hypothetical protein [Schleiferiaceae bacterium]
MQMRRSILALILLGVLSAPIWLSYGLLRWQIHQWRQEVKTQLLQQMPAEALTSFRFSRAQAAALEWEHAGEFAYQGQFYDVVRRDTLGDSLELLVWPDHAESRLHQRIDRLLSPRLQNHPVPQRQRQLTLLYWQLPCLIQPALTLPDRPLSPAQAPHSPFAHYTEPCLSQASPPPRA